MADIAGHFKRDEASTQWSLSESPQGVNGQVLGVVGGLPAYVNAATPLAHKTTHQDGGADELSVAGLSGLLADSQTPLTHAAAKHDSSVEATANKGIANGYASLDVGAKVPVAQLATGTPDGTKFMRDDRSWVTPTAGAADTNPNLYITTADYNLLANRSLYFSAEYEIGDGFVTDLAATAILEIG